MKLTPRARNTFAFWSLQAVLVTVVVAWMLTPVTPRTSPVGVDDAVDASRTPSPVGPEDLVGARAVRDEARRLGQDAALMATVPGQSLEAMTTSLRAWDALGALGGSRAEADLAAALPEVYEGLLRSRAAWLANPTFEHELPYDAVLSPDGELLAVADSQGVTLYDVDSGAVTARLPHATDASTGVLFSADGERVVTFGQHRLDSVFIAARHATQPTPARIWTRRGRIVAELSQAGVTGSGAALSTAGTLVVGGEHGQAHLYDVYTGEHLAVLGDHRGEVDFVGIAADGRRVVTVSHDARGGQARTWDLDGQPRSLVTLDRPFQRAAISPDMTRVATWGADVDGHGDQIDVWRLTGRDAGHEDAIETAQRVHAATFAPAGDALAYASWDAVVVHGTLGDGQWNHVFGAQVRADEAVTALTWSTTGRDLFACGTDGRIHRFDGLDGRPLEVLEGHRDAVTHVAASPDGTLVSIGQDDRVRVWPGEPLDVLPGDLEIDLSDGPVALSRHGGLIVQVVPMGDHLSQVVVASRLRGTVLANYAVDVDAPVGVALRPGPQVQILDDDGHRHVFDALGGDRLDAGSWPGLHATRGDLGTLGLTPSNRRLVVDRLLGEDAHAWTSASRDGRWVTLWHHRADTAVELWDRREGRLVARLDRHHSAPSQVLYSPDGSTVATVENDGTAHLWALPSGRHLATWDGTWQGDEAPDAHFTQHGAGLAVGDRLIYPLAADDLVDAACATLRHAPTADVASVHALCR